MRGPAKTIAMWSGPRNLSTALMYSFAARSDCTIWDEPFYAAYLAATGIEHPMREQILTAHETNAVRVAHDCGQKSPTGKPLFYQKHMTLHMLKAFDRGFMRHCNNVFLIRHPSLVVASYAKKREGPSLDDIGFPQQARLFDEVGQWLGRPPLVVDSQDILANPRQTLSRLCAAVGISFEPSMLSWPQGGHQDDGVWAAHWYGAVHRSQGFSPATAMTKKLSGPYEDLVTKALPYYEALAAHKL